MLIKSYQCSQFGGLKNKRIDLTSGLNVILGPNEAGKSTMVEGIYSTIFKQHKLKNNLSTDKEFKNRFMPKPSGDFIDGSLSIDMDGKEFEINKAWGSISQVKMTLPDGSIIQDDKTIDEELGKILSFGEKTYGNIIFSKQQDLKKAINLILEDSETTYDISALLRKVVMELDGISIEKLQDKIQTQYDDLYKRWNVESDRPENPNQQYKVGLGEIIKLYYQLTNKKQEIARCKSIEQQLDQVRTQLKNIEEKRKIINQQVETYSKIELEVNKRAAIEPKLIHIRENEAKAKEIASNWPKAEVKIEILEEELLGTQKNIDKLNMDLANANKLKEKDRLTKIITKVEKNHEEIRELKDKVSAIATITKTQIKTLEGLKQTIDSSETAIKAGKMQGKIILQNTNIWVTKDFDDKEQIINDTNITANGYIKIEMQDKVAIEIQSGEFDFQELKENLTQAQQRLKENLDSLNVASIEEGKLNLEKLEKYTREIESLKKETLSILDGKTYEDLKAALEELEKISITKSVEDIEIEIRQMRSREMKLSTEHHSLKEKITDWTATYQAADKLFDKMAEYKMELNLLEGQIKNLAPLPEEFSTTEEFSYLLSKLRRELEEYQLQHNKLKDKYYELEKEMPETSTEEMSTELKVMEADLGKLKQKGRSLCKVKKIFEEKLAAMDQGQNSFEPLIQAFSKYLNTLTQNNYNINDLDHTFKLELHKGSTPMPIELLSSGTKDCVALALRLAIIEVLYDQKPGIIVLDDCLVDLDPQRKEKAIGLIQQFAIKNQVIFTTCNPQTAEQLGGKVINI